MSKLYERINTLVLLSLCLYVLAVLYGFGNILNGHNIVITVWNALIHALAS